MDEKAWVVASLEEVVVVDLAWDAFLEGMVVVVMTEEAG